MAFKLKLKQVKLSGEKSSPFKISNSLVYGAGVAANKFTSPEDAYAVGAGEGLKEGGSGFDPFKIGKKGGNPTPKTCDEQFDKLDQFEEYSACVAEKEKNQEDPAPEEEEEEVIQVEE